MAITQTGTSTSQVLFTVATNGVICFVFVTCFVVLRLKFPRIYAPKTLAYVSAAPGDRPPELPKDPFSWLWSVLTVRKDRVIKHCGLDGFFFLRYLWMMGCAFLVAVTSWVVLLPVNGTNGHHHKGLDQLSISNISDPNRYYAHVFISWLIYGGVMFMINREMFYYNSLRTAALSSPRYAAKRSSRTVMFRFVPDEMLDTKQFYKMFDGVKRIYISRTNRKLEALIVKRTNMVSSLERVENKLLKMAVQAKLKAEKKGETIEGNLVDSYVPEKKRPKVNIGGTLWGRNKVDAIGHYLEEIPKLNHEIRQLQKHYRKNRPKNSLIVEFETQYAAQIALQTVVSHEPNKFIPTDIGFEPADVVWLNLRMFTLEATARKLISYAAMGALIVLWAIPVAFVGSISSMDTLMKTFPWLGFFKNLPDWAQGVVSGLLPTLLLSALMFMLPIFIRTAAQVAGSPTSQKIEDYTQKVYMVFQIVNGFLVAALMSSVVATVQKIIDHPDSAMQMLASQLPLSSNFYIAYLALNAFTIAGGTLFQVVSLILFYVLGNLLDRTVRAKWTRFTTLDSMLWGTSYPAYTLLAVITLVYAVISPIILLFGAFTFFMIYIAYAHNMIYCMGQSADGRGIYYPNALSQTISGIYLGQICLLGLCAVGKGWGAIVLAFIGLVVTVMWHVRMNHTYNRMEGYIPLDAMRSLDGTTPTPSFNGTTEYEKKVLSRPRKGVLKENEDHAELERELEDDVKHPIVPLLADRDFKERGNYNWFIRYFRYDVFKNFRHAMLDLPQSYFDSYPEEADDKHAYSSPAASAACPAVWIPRDPMGLSAIELDRLQKVVKASDENASFNEKGEIVYTGPAPN
ncbi:uncharacterized protein Rsn1p [Diutina catenulata]